MATKAASIAELFARTQFFRGDPLADDMGGQPGRIHDWRNHVPTELAVLWPTLSPETRMAVAIFANEAASNEDWD